MYDVYCVLKPMLPDDAMVTFTAKDGTVSMRNRQLIHSDITPLSDRKMLEPVIELERGTCGKMTCKVPPHNYLYEYIQDNSTFFVEENGELIFDGPLRGIKKDFNRNKLLTIEGCMSYLNDSWVNPNGWLHPSPTDSNHHTPRSVTENLYHHICDYILYGHNYISPSYKHINMGYMDESIGIDNTKTYNYMYNHETPMTYLNQIKSTFGGYFSISYNDQKQRRLDYQKSDMSNLQTADQTITFGVNLFEYAEELDMTNFYTVIMPFGGKYTDGQGLEHMHDVARVNGGDKCIRASQELIDIYGEIPKRIYFDEIGKGLQASDEISNTLKQRAIEEMSNLKLKNLKITVTAEDLHYLNPSIKRLTTASKVRVISRPHNVDIVLPCSKIKIDLANPSASKYELTNSEENVNYKDVFVKSGNTTLSALMSMVYKKGQNIK